MAFVRLAFFPGGTEAQYRALARELEEAGVPAGRRLFAAGAVAGGWQVVQVWDRREDLEEFNRRWLLPAMGRVGAAGFPSRATVTDFDARDAWLGPTRLA